MITFIKGKLVHSGQLMGGTAFWVIENNGIGYTLWTHEATLRQCPPVNTEVTAHTAMIVREDVLQLVGFLHREERDLYELLGTASGVGPKMALSMMSALSVSEVAAAILAGDHKRLSLAKGVGPKLAQKMAIELKEKMKKWADEKRLPGVEESSGVLPESPIVQEAEMVLISLGYSPEETRRALVSICQQAVPASSEVLLQQVLKWLAVHV
jgi:holliday junction DNA helicase RuvA